MGVSCRRVPLKERMRARNNSGTDLARMSPAAETLGAADPEGSTHSGKAPATQSSLRGPGLTRYI